MIKSDLIAAVATKAKTIYIGAERAFNSIIDSMRDALVRGERIELRGFGSFSVKEYDAYTGRNPMTGEKIEVKEKRLPVIKCGKGFAERINS